MIIRIVAIGLLASLTACTAHFKSQCQDIGLEPGTSEFAQCVLWKEARMVDAINQASAQISAAAIAATPQTYNYNVHYYRH